MDGSSNGDTGTAIGNTAGMSHVDDVLRNSTLAEVYLDNCASFLVEANLNVLSHAVLTMSKFSDQLHLEPTVHGLCLKSINSTKSAYASVFLTKDFFTEANVEVIHKDDYNLCRISMKAALAVFRPTWVQQRASSNKLSCTIHVDPKADYMLIKIGQTYSIGKVYVIPLRETADTYNHLFTDKSKLANCLKLEPRVLLDVLLLVGNDSDVLKFVAMPDKFVVERFIALEQDRSIKRKTVAVIDLENFQLYSINRPTEVAINVRELKAVLHFADGCGLAVSVHFEQPERPVIIAFEENVEFAASFVLATFDCGATMLLGEAEVQEQDQERGQEDVHHVFDLSQKTPNPELEFANRTILCAESGDEEE